MDSFLWSDILWASKDHIILHLRNTKTSKNDFVDIFDSPVVSTCPVSALLKLQGMVDSPPSRPVFCWASGTFVTVKEFNKLLFTLLEPFLGLEAHNISAHSFIAAIPSLLASSPSLAGLDDIMGWGRWKSSANLTYICLKSEQKRIIFNKILSLLTRGPRSTSDL